MRIMLVAAIISALLLSPTACLASIPVLVPVLAARLSTSCDNKLQIGAVPSQLTARTSDGITVTLDRTQLTHAATIATIGSRISGVGREGVCIALMAALTESSLRMLANTGAWPESAGFPNDGNGADHDSLGLFQMRPLAGWGTVAQLMDSTYQARAFFGGMTGPNRGSPRGLLDIPDWQQLPPGAAAQAVVVSAFPDRYARFGPVADAILTVLARSADKPETEIAETSTTIFPLPSDTWRASSPYGSRIDPVTHHPTVHTGNDYAAPLGTPILAFADGLATYAGPHPSGYGHLILIDHAFRGREITSGYAHMYATGIHVRVGDRVTAGQHIGDVGSDGKSTGPHLHFEIRVDGRTTNPTPWLERTPNASEPTTGACPPLSPT